MSNSKSSKPVGRQSGIDLARNAAEVARQNHIQVNRAVTLKSGGTPGPSGKQLVITKQLPSKPIARDYALSRGSEPIHHPPHKAGQQPHFHTTSKGEKDNSGIHVGYSTKAHFKPTSEKKK